MEALWSQTRIDTLTKLVDHLQEKAKSSYKEKLEVEQQLKDSIKELNSEIEKKSLWDRVETQIEFILINKTKEAKILSYLDIRSFERENIGIVPPGGHFPFTFTCYCPRDGKAVDNIAVIHIHASDHTYGAIVSTSNGQYHLSLILYHKSNMRDGKIEPIVKKTKSWNKGEKIEITFLSIAFVNIEVR